MKQILTIILLTLSTILYSQQPVKVEIITEEGTIGRFFTPDDKPILLSCFNPNSLINTELCKYTLYLTQGNYGYINSYKDKQAWFWIDSITGASILKKSEDLEFTIWKQ